MTLREKIYEVYDGISHCAFDECDACPYKPAGKEDCSQKLLFDAADVIMRLVFAIR